MSPTLDRDEIAVRLACALIARDGYDDEGAPRDAVTLADALLRSLAPTPAPVAPPAGKYEPRVGDVVRYKGGATFGAGGLCVLIAPSKKSSNGAWKAYALDDGCPHGDPIPTMSYYWEYLRPATPSELAAAGLAVPPPAPTPAPEAKCEMCGGPHVRDVFHAADLQPPAPEAKRPTHVRITGPKGQLSVTIGKVYEVLYFDDDRARLIIKNDDGVEWGLSNKPDDGPAFPTWAPAPCPPPVAGRGEALPEDVRDFLLDVEYAAKWANQPQGPTVEYVKGRLKELAALAHDILSRPVRP